MTVDVARRVRVSVSDAEVRRSIIATMRSVSPQQSLSVVFVSSREMRRLNRTYHGEDRVTDVLAFPQASGVSAQLSAELGEIVICPAYVKAQAQRAGESFRRELTRVLIHGTLHLLGYDHARPRDAERMFGMQEEIVRKLF